ncbi:hypothetical protein BpHYR1_017497 [Brachionus plicatilis]|uniref:Uncharacterized protein n=1 Tax=Brachionus plicatilis TaxID=10195 RepID=A0A3M7QQ26_BRAPC|nr:hypothetical protein BpHYR1_017497 [Brachionus plicatilis]
MSVDYLGTDRFSLFIETRKVFLREEKKNSKSKNLKKIFIRENNLSPVFSIAKNNQSPKIKIKI